MNGNAPRLVQKTIHPVGMYCSQRQIGDEILNWNQTSREIFNFVREICKPGPMSISWLGEEEVFINAVELVPQAPNLKGIPGTVLFTDKAFVFVKTKDFFVKLLDYQKNGRSLRTGDRLKRTLPKI